MKLNSKWLRYSPAVLGGVLVVGGLILVSLYLYFNSQLPSIESLKDVRFQVPLRVYSADGKLVGEFGEMKRTPLKYQEVPDLMINAVLSAEDDRFFEHPGVDYQGILRAAWSMMKTGERSQGGSTITMQVARNFFLGREKTFLRKFNEIFLSFKIENELTKEEILELYLNKIYLGNRAYGVAAAAQAYYGVELPQLSVAQIAMIAGLPKAPSKYNPVVNPERALERRNYVLRRMHELKYIDQATYELALAEVDTAQLHALSIDVEAPYLAEMVRAAMVDQFGEEQTYTAGFRVYTSIDSKLQKSANRALHEGLISYGERHGYRGPERHVSLPEGATPEEVKDHLQDFDTFAGLQAAVVMASAAEEAQVVLGNGLVIRLGWEGVSWAVPAAANTANNPQVDKVLKPGDIIRVEKQADERWRLSQIPEVGGALVALHPQTGAIVALVGGFDFYHSKFNRAVQAARQPGSSFKPFIYSAALEKGYTPATIVNDAPLVFEDAGLEDTWRPENYSGEFYGPTRLREALVNSRNLVSIRVLQGIGIDSAIQHAMLFGFSKEALPRNLSLALGSGTVSPLALATGYAVFANGGYRVAPYFIERITDVNGKVLLETQPPVLCEDCESMPPAAPVMIALPEGEVALKPVMLDALPKAQAPRSVSAQNIYLMTSMMRDVIARGTGRRALELGRRDIAGKTGTTNDQRDAWFAGYNHSVVTTAWMGFDDVRPLGESETGGFAALPMWIDFMRVALEGVPEQAPRRPAGLVSVRIDPETGLLAGSGSTNAIFETFMADHVPTATAVSSGGSKKSGDGSGKSTTTMPEQLF